MDERNGRLGSLGGLERATDSEFADSADADDGFISVIDRPLQN